MEGQKRFICLMLSTIAACLSGGVGCSEKPANWYYYWEKDDVIAGLDAAGSPASRWSSDSSAWGGASGPDNGYALSDRCINEPAQTPTRVRNKGTLQWVDIGCTTTFGIEMAAITMAHEKQHILNYQLRKSPGQADTDRDGLADSQEGIPLYNLIIGEKDTYNLATVFGYAKYANYGDDEFICRIAEPSGLGAANTGQDWSKDGAQWRH
jgi:hypothetical protein